MNKYYLRARLLPTTITCIPIYILVHSVITKTYSDRLEPLLSVLPMLTSLGISVAFVFLLIQVNRTLSKEIFQRFYFKEETHMPSTDFLLYQNDFLEMAVKEKLRNKIKTKYDIELLSQTEESQKVSESRKRIAFAVSQIRNSLRDNALLLQHNIEYGFFRNLIGGCVLAVIFSIIIGAYAFSINDKQLVYIGFSLALIYLIPILLSKMILSVFGKNYAKILFEQFLSLS